MFYSVSELEYIQEYVDILQVICKGLSNTCLIVLIQISERYNEEENFNPSTKNKLKSLESDWTNFFIAIIASITSPINEKQIIF